MINQVEQLRVRPKDTNKKEQWYDWSMSRRTQGFFKSMDSRLGTGSSNLNKDIFPK